MLCLSLLLLPCYAIFATSWKEANKERRDIIDIQLEELREGFKQGLTL